MPTPSPQPLNRHFRAMLNSSTDKSEWSFDRQISVLLDFLVDEQKRDYRVLSRFIDYLDTRVHGEGE